MVDFFRNFFTVNRELIFFIYGLTFFVLGLAIALTSRHSSHLEFARSLNWLAAFGFLHGFHEWGQFFIPLQSTYLSPTVIQALNYLNLILLAVSLSCLYGFGLALLEPLQHLKWLHISFATLLLVWMLLAIIPFRAWFADFNTWYNSVDAITRYLIGLPSGMLAAYALREHTFRRIVPMDVPRIVSALQISGITMFIYALVVGLIVPPVSFFPGNLINTATFTHYLILPPQLIRAIIGLAMAMTTIRFLEIFDVVTNRQIEAMEQERIVLDERERIARELHDGTIQKVYTAGLLVRSAQKLAKPETPLSGRLATAVGVLDDAIGDLRQNLNELHTPAQPPQPLKPAILKLASDPRFASLVAVELNLDLPDTCSLSPQRTLHVLAVLQEALANIVRHAHARHVIISSVCQENRLRLTVIDDGIGLPEQLSDGYGLRNMRERAALLQGGLQVEKLSRGTRVTLDIPMEEAV
jgi:signal transduction histidine kinase